MLSLQDGAMDHAIALGVERDGAHGRPVAGVSRPACGVALACGGIQAMPGRQDVGVGAKVALPRADVPQTAMAMRVVVPIDEGLGPTTGRLEAFEPARRELRRVSR